MNTAVLQGLPQRPWWPWAMRGLALVFVSFVGYMLYQYARDIQWSRVDDSVRALPTAVLATAAALAACSHLLYSTFDLLGRRYTGHTLSTPTVMGVTFTSYAFNLNLGSIVGGVGLRYRLYSRLGLRGGVITSVLTLSLLTNWLGYMLLAGAVFAAAVILDAPIAGLADSKKLSAKTRERLAEQIKSQARAWAIASASVAEIDELNILQASMLAMTRAVQALSIRPDWVWVSGSGFPE